VRHRGRTRAAFHDPDGGAGGDGRGSRSAIRTASNFRSTAAFVGDGDIAVDSLAFDPPELTVTVDGKDREDRELHAHGDQRWPEVQGDAGVRSNSIAPISRRRRSARRSS